MSDLIDRQAAIDAVKSRKTAEQSSAGIMRNAVVDFCVDIIKKLPSAQPEQRTGKWIPQDHNKRAGNISTCVYCYPICSKCGKVGIETYKYCPMCGAKMEVTT